MCSEWRSMLLRNFNSIKVQLKLVSAAYSRFREHNFNSIKVQLKLVAAIGSLDRENHFNSIKVQLKPHSHKHRSHLNSISIP